MEEGAVYLEFNQDQENREVQLHALVVGEVAVPGSVEEGAAPQMVARVQPHPGAPAAQPLARHRRVVPGEVVDHRELHADPQEDLLAVPANMLRGAH